MLASECPNCGHLQSGYSFISDPGPVQKHLRDLVKAAFALVDQYQEDRSDSFSDNVNSVLSDIEEAGYVRSEVVFSIGLAS